MPAPCIPYMDVQAHAGPIGPGGARLGFGLEALRRFGKGPRVILIHGLEFYSYMEGRPPPHCVYKRRPRHPQEGRALSNKQKRYRQSRERNPSYIHKHPAKRVDRHRQVPHQLAGSPLVTPWYVVSLYNPPIQAGRRVITHLKGART